MEKIVGFDLGTNSIGITVRNPDKGDKLEDQLIYFRSVIFPSGVGKGDKGEFSFAAERTKKKATRSCLWARKQRIWATLRVLIKYGYCPLSETGLNNWSRYNKSKGQFREYPINETQFEQWVRLDFDQDGKADYNNPFDIRKELTERKFNLDDQLDRYRFGRAIYHIAQHRGFKSSKGETLKEMTKKENSDSELDVFDELKKSEEKRAKRIIEYMEDNGLQTVGQAYSKLISEGKRIRESEFNAVRSQFKQELIYIFNYQGLDINSDFCKAILSEKKKEGTIFYKRPLRSQKGAVGKCVFEKNKARCPISHPEFEYFRAISFINNIKFRESVEDDWQTLSVEHKQRMLNERFLGIKQPLFKFSDLRKWIQRNITENQELEYVKGGNGTINYPDDTSVSGCPVTARLIDLLGENWETSVIETSHERANTNTGEIHKVTYSYEDIWHLCFMLSTSDEPEKLIDVAKNTLGFDDANTAKLKALYNNIAQGYAKISLKALKNINYFLRLGFIYSHAVLLAKMPSIFGDRWNEVSNDVVKRVAELKQKHDDNKEIYRIVNNLISKYKQLTYSHKFGFKNRDYKLCESDFSDIDKEINQTIGNNRFSQYSTDKQSIIRTRVAELYQEFFSKSQSYLSVPPLVDYIAENIAKEFNVNQHELKMNLYHPSMIEFYPPAKDGLLGSPVIDAIRNPMAMRVLHTLRREINTLLEEGIIDAETRIVVETARELNDANWRAAITTYNNARNEENQEFEKILKQYFPDFNITKTDIDKTRLLLQQSEEFCENDNDIFGKPEVRKKFINKYRLWLEQRCRSIYTGNIIKISDLLNGNYDIEHTVPRSISFDDSLANMTICESDFNRDYKKNMLPANLGNLVYNGINVSEKIAENIKPWQDKVKRLEASIEAYALKSSSAQDKETKDSYIRKRHVLELEYDYWVKKVDTFTKKEYSESYRNNQLNDTRTITKYAFHYLKSLFSNVSVQRGETTAMFRKILGLQNINEKKNRDLHSHHAIDATVLTLIPNQDAKKALITLFFQKEEAKRINANVEYYESQLSEKIDECNIPKTHNLVNFIQNKILVNYRTKDNTFAPSHRRVRCRGRIYVDKNKHQRWKSGDSFRGSLHKDTFYGVIRQPKMENNVPIMKDGKFVYDKKKCEVVVKRVPIKEILDSKKFDIIIDPYVRRAIEDTYKSRIDAKISKADASSLPIWMTGKNQSIDGNCERKEVRFDKNGHPIAPIRHVRCKAKAGRGFLKPESAIQLKEQTYKSERQLIHLADRNHKELYRVQNDENYACLYFEDEINGNTTREFELVSNLDVAKMGIKCFADLKKYASKRASDIGIKLKTIILRGTRILLWSETPEELYDCDLDVLNKRLFVVYKFNDANCIYTYSIHHLWSRENIPSSTTKFNTNVFSPHLQLSSANFNCLIEGVDFDIDSVGNIIFRNR